MAEPTAPIDVIEPVVREVTAGAPVDTCFRVFVHEFASWWPTDHHIGEGRTIVDFRIEPEVGGRCYDVDTDGGECHWGTVLAIEPPTRLLLAWHIQGDWTVDLDPASASEVEVTFSPLAADRTAIRLEHRGFERHGEGGAAMRQGVSSEGGWLELIQRAADVIDGRPPMPLGAAAAPE